MAHNHRSRHPHTLGGLYATTLGYGDHRPLSVSVRYEPAGDKSSEPARSRRNGNEDLLRRSLKRVTHLHRIAAAQKNLEVFGLAGGTEPLPCTPTARVMSSQKTLA